MIIGRYSIFFFQLSPENSYTMNDNRLIVFFGAKIIGVQKTDCCKANEISIPYQVRIRQWQGTTFKNDFCSITTKSFLSFLF
jgi:hypothetical protein